MTHDRFALGGDWDGICHVTCEDCLDGMDLGPAETVADAVELCRLHNSQRHTEAPAHA